MINIVPTAGTKADKRSTAILGIESAPIFKMPMLGDVALEIENNRKIVFYFVFYLVR